MADNNTTPATDDSQALATEAETQFAKDTGRSMDNMPSEVNDDFVQGIQTAEKGGLKGEDAVGEVVAEAEISELIGNAGSAPASN